jgi:DNA-binding MarR family transcriptional regulator
MTGSWTFLTNHAQVLLAISREPTARMRDIAEAVGITERATQRIIGDLVTEGYIERRRVGRRNEYEVREETRLRHPLARDHEIGEILGVLRSPRPDR